jgi:hypothetical protein
LWHYCFGTDTTGSIDASSHCWCCRCCKLNVAADGCHGAFIVSEDAATANDENAVAVAGGDGGGKPLSAGVNDGLSKNYCCCCIIRYTHVAQH